MTFLKIVQIIITSFFSLAVLFILTKTVGARQISEMTMFDYIISISIGSIAAEMATELEKPYKPLIAMVVYGLVSLLIAKINEKSLKVRKMCIGTSKILMYNGKMLRENFKKEHIHLNEFLMQARTNGYFDISAIHTAIVEPSGKISFMPFSRQRPVTASDLNITPQNDDLFYNVILDGCIIEKSLKLCGRDTNWLNAELKKQNISNIKTVFLATADKNGTLNVFKIS